MDRIVAALVATAVFAVTAHTAHAAEPRTGVLSIVTPSTQWTGGPFAQSFEDPSGCAGRDDPRCDRFDVTVTDTATMRVTVALAWDDPAADLDVSVLDSDGRRVATGNVRSSGERAVFVHDRGVPETYSVMVQPIATTGLASYRGTASIDGIETAQVVEATHEVVDSVFDCDEVAPREVPQPAVGQLRRVRLDVLVLRDGVKAGIAADVVGSAARAYRPLGIDLVATYDDVELSGTFPGPLLDQARAHVGGRRPEGIDVVHVLTPKELGGGLGGQILGQADCIGGVRYPDRAFSVSTVPVSAPVGVEDQHLVRSADTTAVIAAHEIGHLLGAQHHFANCGEAAGTSGRSVCTVMSTYVGDLRALKFSSVNAAVVRAHALEHARP